MSATSIVRRFSTLGLAAALAACASPSHDTAAHSATDASFARLAALQGEWLEADDGAMVPKGTLVATYRLTGAGSAVVETYFPGAAEEMVTVYHRDGDNLVLTHYCAVGNQPRMRATKLGGTTLDFAFDGGTNIDPSRDMHMHSGHFEFVSRDELLAEWQGWEAGAPAKDHVAKFHLVRRKG